MWGKKKKEKTEVNLWEKGSKENSITIWPSNVLSIYKHLGHSSPPDNLSQGILNVHAIIWDKV